MWEKDREAFYVKYLTEAGRLRDPQTDAMSVGSSFDAYVKSSLHKDLFDKVEPKYQFDALFTEQVEPHVRDFALAAGLHVFEAYHYTGSYDELLRELSEAAEPPQFEFTLREGVRDIPLLGKPDCQYRTKEGAHVMLDWKVNGYCSKHAKSPDKLYSMVRDGQDQKPSRNAGNPHKGYVPMKYLGLTIGSHYLEATNESWTDQLTIYGWMMGEKIGQEDMVARIDQIVAKPHKDGPTLRVANHKARVSTFWQHRLLRRLQDAWEVLNSGHIFTEMTLEDSKSRCATLDKFVEYSREVANDKHP
jgi:hypothetical protein